MGGGEGNSKFLAKLQYDVYSDALSNGELTGELKLRTPAKSVSAGRSALFWKSGP